MNKLPLLLLTLTLGACAVFSDDPRVRTPGTIVDDEVLENLVERDIRKSDSAFKSAHLVVVSYNGVVLLAGQVATQPLKADAQQVAQRVAKVRKVHNEIEVGGPISYVARTNDAWLTGKVKTKLIAADHVNGSKVKVLTENGTVYLMGMLTRAEADAVVGVTSSVYGVQRIVKVFEYLN
ncbi:MAG: BON domain-containing protein [Gammaproteobacteria bacterium]|nr:BON domain-containing protein [Gammaproteobacteria bacterium]